MKTMTVVFAGIMIVGIVSDSHGVPNTMGIALILFFASFTGLICWLADREDEES